MKNKFKYIAKKMIKIFLIVFITIIVYQFYINLQTQTSKADTTQRSSTVDTNSNSITDVLENSFNSVVGISKLKDNGTSIFLMNATEDLGLGTGIIVSKNGYILTNQHVSGDSSCYVTLPDGNTTKAKTIWSDEDLDLAIIKVNEKFDTCAQLGNSEEVKIGEDVYAIGNPIGYEFQKTVTAGIISAVNRTVKLEEDNEYVYMSNLIQTDATINPGNSGGPLIDENGEIIGINSIKITSADSMGFAIPINIVKPIIEKLNTTGKFEEAYLGIFAYDSSIIQYIDKNIDLKNGIYVEKINEDGPAYEAELKTGDIITKIDDVEVNKMSKLQEYIYTKSPKDTVTLTINRNNKEKTITIELDKREK